MIRTIYSGIFTDIQRHIKGLLRRMEPKSDILGTFRNPKKKSC